MNIGFSIDDFGTGYSSLSYLKSLPINQIKIDQTFVRDICIDQNDAVIVETIILMASSLGLEVIAEGVENEEQLQFLESRGCKTFQGYYFSKPLAAESFEINYMNSASPA
jgi:EAL domain-containing protein (putative c-di-GMP-specific phosphodiesterase class I)